MPTDALRAYAATRQLAYEEEGLLPPIATVLKRGLGAGEHARPWSRARPATAGPRAAG